MSLTDGNSEQAEARDFESKSRRVVSPVEVDLCTVPLDDAHPQDVVDKGLLLSQSLREWNKCTVRGLNIVIAILFSSTDKILPTIINNTKIDRLRPLTAQTTRHPKPLVNYRTRGGHYGTEYTVIVRKSLHLRLWRPVLPTPHNWTERNS